MIEVESSKLSPNDNFVFVVKLVACKPMRVDVHAWWLLVKAIEPSPNVRNIIVI
jgi:hypothetical protein